MPKSHRNIFVNSTLAFVSAFIITTIIHESGHYIASYLFGSQPKLYHNYVETSETQARVLAIVIIALAGPFISFIQGVIASGVVLFRQKNTQQDLLFLWLGLLGFVNFFGYLMLTPLSTVGDTGKVAELLQIHYTLRVGVSLLGIVALLLIVTATGKEFARFVPPSSELVEKRKYVNAILLFPIIVGSMVNSILAFPVVAVLSVIYPATSPYVILSSYGKVLKGINLSSNDSFIYQKISPFLIGLVIVCVLINRLLTKGY